MIGQVIIFGVIIGALFLFVQAKLRYDLVAMIALLVITLTGITAPADAFSGFAHPAVITVAAILVVSRGLLNVGAMDPLTQKVNQLQGGIRTKLLVLMTVTAFFSSFMNNVGALALVMPVAISVSKKSDISPSYLLMPIAYASLFGGLITEIGTPPNLIISMYRNDVIGSSYNFFSFAPVGILLSIVGIAFVTVLGYKLIPNRKGKEDANSLFKVEDYLSELRIPEGHKIVGKPLRDFASMHQMDVNILSIVRNKINIIAPLAREIIEEGDTLVVRMEPTDLAALIEKTGLQLKGAKITPGMSGKMLNVNDYSLIEMVIRDDSPLIGHSAKSINLRNNYSVNLVAVSRQGVQLRKRLGEVQFRTGDILLIQVADQNIKSTLDQLRGLPLAERGLTIGNQVKTRTRRLALAVFLASILLSTLGWLPVQISFTLAAVLMVLLRIIPIKEVYNAIEWPVVVLLGAMIPLGAALETTGAADTIASMILLFGDKLTPEWVLGILMVITMMLTNLINNSAAALLMAPIAISLATAMSVSPDPLLMAVAISSSCAFMTPIGHQSNTLIMGPGGYHFSDYWQMGLPVSLLFLLIGGPAILWIWPL